MIPKTFPGMIFLAGLFLFVISYMPNHIKVNGIEMPGVSKQGQKVFRVLGSFFMILGLIPPIWMFINDPSNPIWALAVLFKDLF